jgi:xanthine/uracil permease
MPSMHLIVLALRVRTFVLSYYMCQDINNEIHFIYRKFSPVIMTPVVCVVGLGLFEIGFPQVLFCAFTSKQCSSWKNSIQRNLSLIFHCQFRWVNV